jgi:hypothetical protein
MEILFVTLGVFLGVVLAMSVGVIFKRKPIQGSCGGIANIMGKSGCDICELKSECVEKNKKLCEDHDHEHDHA